MLVFLKLYQTVRVAHTWELLSERLHESARPAQEAQRIEAHMQKDRFAIPDMGA